MGFALLRYRVRVWVEVLGVWIVCRWVDVYEWVGVYWYTPIHANVFYTPCFIRYV